MAEPSHIIVVDDEPEICSMLADYLGHAGFAVSTAGDGSAMRRLLEERPADLVILDINMPGEDGLSLARYLRANVRCRHRHADRGRRGGRPHRRSRDGRRRLHRQTGRSARAAGAGARGPAPCAGGRAAGRRSGGTTHQIRFGPCRLDLDAHKLYDAEGEEVPITSMEFDLLKAFADHPNHVLSRDQLLDLAHHKGWEPFDRSIDIRIARLRRKVEADPSKPQVIKTVRGAGYIFVPKGE